MVWSLPSLVSVPGSCGRVCGARPRFACTLRPPFLRRQWEKRLSKQLFARESPVDDRRLHALAGAAAGVLACTLADRRQLRWSLACKSQGGAEAFSNAAIDKPETHRRRQYEYIQLKNGLNVILASDPTCDKSAAALCVGVGQLHEPKDMSGLAHFCEHMLFLGTHAFPDEGEYRRFLKQHGGRCNAATGDNMTCYAFDVAPTFLPQALDRFSAFFVSPLFSPSATEREINAVDSEHSMRLTNDSRRSFATLLVDANPRHPLHWGSGNARTLRDVPRSLGKDTHKEVVAFYKKHYTSEDMTLAVLGREPMDDLRQMVEERFAAIRSTGHRAVRGDLHGGDEVAILPADFRGKVLRLPTKDMRVISFSWQLPCWQVPLWRSKPGSYASHLLGHQGEGSLLSALKKCGLATALSAGVSDFGSFSHFEISISLTEKGLDNIEGVGSIVFANLRLIRATPVLTWALDEMQRLNEIRFRFADDMKPYDLVDSIARKLQHFPPAVVLSARSKLFDKDVPATAAFLTHLTVDGVRVEITGKRFAKQCTSEDPYYGGSFARLPLDASWRSTWCAAAGGQADGSSELAAAQAAASALGIRLPKPNPFVPEDLSLVESPPETSDFIRTPVQVTVDPCIALAFHRQDDRFYQPKTSVGFRFHCPASTKDTASFLRCQLWCNAVMEELNEFAYDAKSAGLSYRLVTAPTSGMHLIVSGFHDKLPLLLRRVVKTMKSASSIDPHTFGIVHDRFERSLKNRALKQRPCDFAARKTYDLLRGKSFPVEEQLEALRSMSVTDMDGENQRLLGECQISALFMGNLDSEGAASVAAVLGEELDPPREPKELACHAEAALPEGDTVWHIKGTNPEEKNNCVRLEIQLPSTIENYVSSAMFVRVLSPRFFEDLRTKQQLGYIVQSSLQERESFVNLTFTIQTEYPTDYVRGRIDAFLDSFIDWTELEFDEENFKRQRTGLVTNLAEAPKSLGEEFVRDWLEVGRDRYDFTRRERKRQAMEGLKLSEFRSFVRRNVRAAPRLYVEVRSIAASPQKVPPEGAEPAATPDRIWEGDEARQVFHAEAKWVTPTEEDTPSPVAVTNPLASRL
eukprot:TRINITY_DN28500_c0_g1_i1.p1 TRINITY_DN28500_c0_g1~~TRINITY_DN28500_c0_g1_i1.p1  ORF type:complete len:1087 (-),score=161.98 TRINITY_DN28500_c0_g1_i1:124-3384(-)